MDQGQNSQTTGGQQAPQQGAVSQSKGISKRLMLIIAAVVVIAVVVFVLPSLTSTSLSAITTIAQTSSANSTPVYMGAAQAQLLLGSSVANYTTSDLYNPNSYINMSFLSSLVPQLLTNASSGWVTTAYGSNATTNSSAVFMVITTNNTGAMAVDLGEALNSTFIGFAPNVTKSGSYNDMEYTYDAYQNSTGTYQLLYGWKNKNLVVALLSGNPGWLANETQLVGIAANDSA